MWRNQTKCCLLTAAVAIFWQTTAVHDSEAQAANGWRGKRQVSYQNQKDLFYNYYVGPAPSGTAAQLYVSPLPVPAFVGHTWITYQPLMPHEFLYKHQRAYYTYNEGAGWTRTKVRYGTGGCCCCSREADVPNSRFTDSLNDSISGVVRFIVRR